MPSLIRMLDGRVVRPGVRLSLILADGTAVEGVWAGSATEEKLGWHLRQPGNQLSQSEPVAAIACKAEDDDELIWGDAPSGACVLFVLQPPPRGKTYRLMKMVTTAATAAQAAYFRTDRVALFGKLGADGKIAKISPVDPPPPSAGVQGEVL